MAALAVRCAFSNGKCMGSLLGRQPGNLWAVKTKLTPVAPIQVATLQATHGEKYPYLNPWPYEKKKFTLFHEYVLMERSLDRICENSKIIVVEGNIGVGKNDFAEKLAREFDLKFFPSVSSERLWYEFGFDIRELDDVLPERTRSYDLTKYLADTDPSKWGRAGILQMKWYKERFFEYVRVMRHLFHTGQGAVMVRSAFSDRVFLEAFYRMGWTSPEFRKQYNFVREQTIDNLWYPHLTIYLDAPQAVIKERIKARNDPREVNSPVLTDKYLQQIDKVYKSSLLPEMRKYGEVLEVDWTEVGDEFDMEVIAEEIQLLNLEPDPHQDIAEDVKFHDWTSMTDDSVATYRRMFDNMDVFKELFILPHPSLYCPELVVPADDIAKYRQIMDMHPCKKYKPGYRSELGENAYLKLI